MDTEPHWLSYTQHEGLHGYCILPSTECMISIVLDDDARYNFCAIRLLVVRKHSERLSYVSVKDSHDPARHMFFAESLVRSTHPSHRTRLTRRRSAYQSGKLIQAATTTSLVSVPPLQICTVMFELIDTGKSDADGVGVFTLVPCPRLPSNPSLLQIAYDRVQPIDAASPSLLVFLDTNVACEHVPPELRDNEYPSAIPAHSIRVLPTSRRHKSPPVLSPHVIYRIVDLAIGWKPLGWRTALLGYALVCKSWTHVLDLFFERFDGTFEGQKVEVLSVSHSLKARPERGALMQTLDFRDYKQKLVDGRENEATFFNGLDDWNAFLNVVQCATSAKDVYLENIPGALTAQLVRAFSLLHKVRRCVVFQNKGPLTIPDVQTFIVKWRDLVLLEVRDWAHRPDMTESTNQLECNLEDLVLSCGIITGQQMLRFVSSPVPRLKQLNLEKVQGISNREFTSFLASVASTIHSISLFQCPMPNSSPDEELALDRLMPDMITLEYLLVDGTHVSALALSRKGAATTTLPGARPACNYISISPASQDMTIGQVAEAMKVTGWNVISVLWEAVSGWDKSLEDKTMRIAQERRIAFHCWHR